MAQFNSLTFGTISGRHGSAVATTTKNGKSFLRVYRKPKDAKTEKQVAHRNKFSFAIASLSSMREIFKNSFKNKGGYNYGFAKAMSSNVITGDAPNFEIDYSKLLFSEGSVTAGHGLVISKTASDSVKVDWNNSNISTKVDGGAKANEIANLVVFNETLRESLYMRDAAERIEGTAELEYPDYWAGSKVHCWIYFSRANSTMNSVSQYAGELML